MVEETIFFINSGIISAMTALSHVTSDIIVLKQPRNIAEVEDDYIISS